MAEVPVGIPEIVTETVPTNPFSAVIVNVTFCDEPCTTETEDDVTLRVKSGRIGGGAVVPPPPPPPHPRAKKLARAAIQEKIKLWRRQIKYRILRDTQTRRIKVAMPSKNAQKYAAHMAFESIGAAVRPLGDTRMPPDATQTGSFQDPRQAGHFGAI